MDSGISLGQHQPHHRALGCDASTSLTHQTTQTWLFSIIDAVGRDDDCEVRLLKGSYRWLLYTTYPQPMVVINKPPIPAKNLTVFVLVFMTHNPLE